MTTASESCDTTSQMSLFGETCEPLPERTFFPTPTQSDGTRDGKAYRKDTNMFEGGSHSVQLSHLAAHGLLHTPTGTANQLSPSMAVRDAGSWGLSPQAIPASHSHSPGSDWARRMTATYGRKLSAYWLSCDPPDSWVRTLLGISTWASTTCYLTWKKSVTPAGRLLFRLVPSTPRTAGIGSGSLLATPRAIYGEHPGMEDESHLTGQAIERERLWPTPKVGGGGNSCELTPYKGHFLRPSGKKADFGLDQAARMWPTPRAEFDSGRHRGQPDTLHSAVKLWGTPTSRDHKDVGDMTNVPENGLLGRQVLNDARTYPTPQARDWKGAQGRAYKGESMDLPATVSVAGLKLNSAWVSRMMGYPDNWLDLTPDGEATP
jgi:hypothetical protein